MNGKAVYVGIDRGGTWARFCGLDRAGRRVFSEKHPSPLIKKFPELIKKVLDANAVPPTARCVIATKGAIANPWKDGYLKKEMAGRLNVVEVMSDMEASVRAALHGRAGIAVLAGTGSVACGINGARMAKAGGLGPVLGDEGSAYNVAAVSCAVAEGKAVCFAPEKVAKIAFSAKDVLAAAKRGDRAAVGAVMLGAVKLARQAHSVVEELGLESPLLFTYDGSMMKDDFFRKHVLAALTLYSGITRFTFVPPCESAPWCAARAAKK